MYDLFNCDIYKTFDNVLRKNLPFKLKSYGKYGKIQMWIKDYGGVQRISLNGFHFSFTPVSSEVIKGSVLGPIPFLPFIDDISDNKVKGTRLFAYDISLIIEIWKMTQS